MQHDPYVKGLVQADLDEVVTRAQRAQVTRAVECLCLGVFFRDRVVSQSEGAPLERRFRWQFVPCALVVAATVVCAPMRHRRLDVCAHAPK